MGLFYNNYQRLYQENVDEYAKLSKDNRTALRKMWDYVDSYNISLFELEVIKKDLIGIAGEADLEGVSVADKLGISEKEFCDSLTSGIVKKNRFEQIMIFTKNWFLGFLVIYITYFLLSGIPAKFEIPTWYLFYSFLLAGIWNIFYKSVDARKLYGDNSKYKKRKKIAVLLSLGLYMCILILIILQIPVIKGNGWIMLAVLCSLTALLFFGNNIYWDKCSEKYNWR